MHCLTQSLRQSASSLWKVSTTLWTIRNTSTDIKANLRKVRQIEKRALVWTGKYKTIGDVPDLLTTEVIDKARNKMRIRIANIMIVATLVACVAISISAKRAHERGESLTKENLEWHQSQKK